MRRLILVLPLMLAAGCGSRTSTNVFIDPALATLVPSDTVFLAGIRLDKLKETPVYKRFVGDRPIKPLEQFQKETGLDPRKDLWEFLVAGNGKDSVVFCRGKFSEFGLEPKLERPGVQRMSYKGLLMLGNEQTAVLFANASVAIAGPTPMLRSIIDNRDKSSTGIPAWLQQKINSLPPASQIWLAGDVGRALGGLSVEQNGTAGNFAQFAPNIELATAGLDFRSGLKAEGFAQCRTEDDAKRLGATIRAAVGMARLNTPAEETAMLRALDGIKSEIRENRNVALHIDIGPESLDRLLNFAESMRPSR